METEQSPPTTPSFNVFRCPSCGKPTPEKGATCRHCNAVLRGDDAGRQAGFLERVFGINTTGGRLGCFGTLGAIVAIPVLGIAYCSDQAEKRAVEEAKIAAEKKAEDDRIAEERYKDSVTNGNVCADGWGGSNIDLVSTVKSRLRDPDSFEHEQTTISGRSPKGQYVIFMRYRARNGFGGLTGGWAAGRLALVGRNDCRVIDLRMDN